MNFDLKVEGLSALQEQLLNLGAEAGAKALTAATRKAFLPVLERARALVPVITGELRDSIKIGVVKPGSSATIAAAGLFIGKPAGAAAGAPLKAYQRKGANERNVPPSVWWKKVELGDAQRAAHPFMRPALDQLASQVVDQLKVEIQKKIEAALRKKARGK